jgi:hypothetical protein
MLLPLWIYIHHDLFVFQSTFYVGQLYWTIDGILENLSEPSFPVEFLTSLQFKERR